MPSESAPRTETVGVAGMLVAVAAMAPIVALALAFGLANGWPDWAIAVRNLCFIVMGIGEVTAIGSGAIQSRRERRATEATNV